MSPTTPAGGGTGQELGGAGGMASFLPCTASVGRRHMGWQAQPQTFQQCPEWVPPTPPALGLRKQVASGRDFISLALCLSRVSLASLLLWVVCVL